MSPIAAEFARSPPMCDAGNRMPLSSKHHPFQLHAPAGRTAWCCRARSTRNSSASTMPISRSCRNAARGSRPSASRTVKSCTPGRWAAAAVGTGRLRKEVERRRADERARGERATASQETTTIHLGFLFQAPLCPRRASRSRRRPKCPRHAFDIDASSRPSPVPCMAM